MGVRLAAGEAPKRAATWRCRGVPFAWSTDDVQSCLSGAGLSEVEVLDRGRGRIPWLVRCCVDKDDGRTSFIIQVGNLALDLERSQPRRKLTEVSEQALKVSRKQARGKQPTLNIGGRRPNAHSKDVDMQDAAGTAMQVVVQTAIPRPAPSRAPTGNAADRGRRRDLGLI